MFGNIVNAFAIIVGSLIGIFIKKEIPENIKDTIMNGLALCSFLVGVLGITKASNVMLIIFSIVIGAVIGEVIGIENFLDRFGKSIENKFKSKGSNIAQAFVASTLITCVGSMAIVGALESGLTGNHTTLFTKALLDFVTTIIFSSSLGIGVIFSSISVIVYQGTITLFASLLKVLLVPNIINDITAVGSLIIIGLSLNILKATNIKVANLLPAVLVPVIYQSILSIIIKL
jgi:uncharacterized membrane protein YqgA involved in biofilm formation